MRMMTMSTMNKHGGKKNAAFSFLFLFTFKSNIPPFFDYFYVWHTSISLIP
jgi:hypothetical protein